MSQGAVGGVTQLGVEGEPAGPRTWSRRARPLPPLLSTLSATSCPADDPLLHTHPLKKDPCPRDSRKGSPLRRGGAEPCPYDAEGTSGSGEGLGRGRTNVEIKLGQALPCLRIGGP